MSLFDAFRTQRLAVLSGLATEVCQSEWGEAQVEHPKAMKNPRITRRIPYAYRGVPFAFATEAWLAPLCVRADVWHDLGGFDESLALSGEPGIGLDIHLSLRAGVLGYSVGVFGALFERGVGGHGTVSSPEKTKLRLRKRAEIGARIRAVAGCRWPPEMLGRARLLNEEAMAREMRNNMIVFPAQEVDESVGEAAAKMKAIAKELVEIGRKEEAEAGEVQVEACGGGGRQAPIHRLCPG